jgi:hypothetical protein
MGGVRLVFCTRCAHRTEEGMQNGRAGGEKVGTREEPDARRVRHRVRGEAEFSGGHGREGWWVRREVEATGRAAECGWVNAVRAS